MSDPGEDNVSDFTDIGDVGATSTSEGGYGEGAYGEGAYGGSASTTINFEETGWTDIVRP